MTERPSQNEVSMQAARNAARRGTCSRLQVGAVITVSGRLISSGYNGAPAGLEHCSHECDCAETTGHYVACIAGDGQWHKEACASLRPCSHSVHAESNAIAFAAKYGVSTDKATMYVTHAPCLKCAQLIINAGITKVIWADPYRAIEGITLLCEADIWCDSLAVAEEVEH